MAGDGIVVTPQLLEDLAKELDGCEGVISDAAEQFIGAVTRALEAWQGKARQQYEARFNEVSPILTKTIPELIHDMSTEARSRAKKFSDADA